MALACIELSPLHPLYCYCFTVPSALMGMPYTCYTEKKKTKNEERKVVVSTVWCLKLICPTFWFSTLLLVSSFSTLFSLTFQTKNPALCSLLLPFLSISSTCLIANILLCIVSCCLWIWAAVWSADNLFCAIWYLSVLSHLLHHVQFTVQFISTCSSEPIGTVLRCSSC